jgi:radical SAM superfamily enzyme YgiQ (UPF0313 family)
LILGGSGFSVAPHGWMRRLEFDYGVIGEGERTFPELLARLEAGQSPAGDAQAKRAPRSLGANSDQGAAAPLRGAR